MSKIEIIRKYKQKRGIADKYLLDSDEHYLVDEIMALQEQVKKLTLACSTDFPNKDTVYSEIKRLTDLYYSDDNARKSAFGLGVSTGVNLVNKEILN